MTNATLYKAIMVMPLAVSVCTLFCGGDLLADEDRTVTAAETITSGTAYDRLVVNADLTVASGVKLTCNTLCIASNIVGSATLTLEENAQLAVTGKVYRCVMLGAAGGQARLVLKSGSTMTADHISGAYGYEETPAATATPSRSYVVVSNATITLAGSCYSGSSTRSYYGLAYVGGGNWPSSTATAGTVVDVLQLDEGGTIKCKNVRKSSSSAAQIIFNGGCLVQNGSPNNNAGSGAFLSISSSSKKSPIYLDTTNGCDVVLSVSYGAHIFSTGSKSNLCYVRGEGDFVKAGTKIVSLVATGSYFNDADLNLRFMQTGSCRIAEGGIQMATGTSAVLTNTMHVASHEWVVENGATFDLNGCDARMTALTVRGGGVFTNSSETVSQVTLGADDADGEFPHVLSPNMTVKKIGSGKLRLFAGDAEQVAVEDGELVLLGRREMGYPLYKFNAYKTRGKPDTNHQLRITEFKFLEGTTDVTQGYATYYYTHVGTSYANEPTAMWDGDLDTQFYDQRAQSYASVSNIHVEIEYSPVRRVTGYTWATSYSSNSQGSDPVSWEMFGSVDNQNWVSLDRVEDYVPTSSRKAWVGTNFVFRYATTAATIGNITVASGAKLTTSGADVTFSAGSVGAGATLATGAGGSVALPTGTTVASLAVDATAADPTAFSGLVPAASGTLAITGSGTKPVKVLPVAFSGVADGVWTGWTVTYNGERVHYYPKVTNGQLSLIGNRGLVIVFR